MKFKNIVVTLFLVILSVSFSSAQHPKITLGETYPITKELNVKNWNILTVDNNETIAYEWIASTSFSKPSLSLVRFDKSFNVKATKKVKYADNTGGIRSIHYANDKITIIVAYYDFVGYEVLNAHTFETTSSGKLFDIKPSHKVHVRWSPNSEYVAFLQLKKLMF